MSATERKCDPPGVGTCVEAKVKLLSGSQRGVTGDLQMGGASTGTVPDLSVGDKLRVIENPSAPPAEANQSGALAGDEELGPPGGEPAGDQGIDPSGGEPTPSAPSYSFVDFDRTSSLLWLFAAFVASALIVSRMRAARSLLGLALSLGVVIVFIVPAILDGESPLAVAIVGSFAVMLVTMGLAHGIGLKSASAALGTAGALFVTVVLGVLFTDMANLSGFTSEEAAFLQVGEDLSLSGLVLAGIVIGALGVLDDLTITQASTVLALRRADPSLGPRRLFSSALDVGHDHIAATINTLVLAYVGASLPLLLVFSIGDLSLSDTLNKEVIAEQIVVTLVGSIGLFSAVPLTTGLAAMLAARIPAEMMPADAHAH